VVKLENVRKIYHHKKEALKGVSFEIEDGNVVALFRENGAGKTTLLKIIASFLIPESGAVFIDGENIVEKPQVAREKTSIATGYERSFYYRLSVEENLKFFGMLNDLMGKKLKKEVEKIMRLLDLTEFRKVRYMELSGGYRKRMDIARALIKNAEIYIFDEPCSGVDIRTRMKVCEIVEHIKASGKIVIFTSHEMEDLKNADKVVLLKEGRKLGEFFPKVGGVEGKIKEVLSTYPREDNKTMETYFP